MKIYVAKADSRLDKIEDDIEELKEGMAEVKIDTNEMDKWIGKYFSGTMPFPLDDEEEQEINDILNSMKEKH